MKALKTMKLKELSEIKIGLPLERKKAKLISSDKVVYKLLTLKSFAAIDDSTNIHYEMFVADSSINSQYLTKENDVIVRLRAPTTAIYVSSKNTDLVVSSLMAIITNISPNILNSKYLTHYLNSQYIQNQLIKNTQGTSIQMIKVADLLELEINLPPLEKQQQIVNYIYTANQEIDLLHKLIDEKNKLKTEIFETLIK